MTSSRATRRAPDVIVDTSVVQYLHQVGLLHLLRALYDVIAMPRAVADELAYGRSLGVDLPALAELDWMRLSDAPSTRVLPVTRHLGRGELDVIGLALEQPGSLVALDDRLARQYAIRLGLQCTGTLGILLKAKSLGAVQPLRPVLDDLARLGFRLSLRTRMAVLGLAGEDERPK